MLYMRHNERGEHGCESEPLSKTKIKQIPMSKKIHPHRLDAINCLLNEACRFEALAHGYAMKFVKSAVVNAIGRPVVIDQHMLRAQTLREAAALIRKGAA